MRNDNIFSMIDSAISKVTDYFDDKRDREIRDITRRKELAENRYALTKLLQILIHEKKRRQYGAHLFGGDEEYEIICSDIATLRDILNKSEYYNSVDELYSRHRSDLEQLYNSYSHYLY